MRNIRMDIAAYVLLGVAGVVLAFAGLHGFHNKSITIISFGVGAGLVILSGCLYWQDAVWKHDKPSELDTPTSPSFIKSPPAPTGPIASPAITPAPKATLTPAVAPTSPSPTQTPARSLSSITENITLETACKKYSAALQTGKLDVARTVENALKGLRVDWTLSFFSAEESDSNRDNKRIRLILSQPNGDSFK